MPARNMNRAMIHCVSAEKPSIEWLRREAAGRHRRERVGERLVGRHRVVDPEPAERREEQGQHDGHARCRTPTALGRARGSAPRLAISGPGSSDSIICRPPTRRRGRIATARMMIPIPPSHW